MGMSNYIPSSAISRAGVCTSSTRPASPYVGQAIYETNTLRFRFWDGSTWSPIVDAPTGTVNSFAGATAPTGWLLCGGQAVSRTTYSDLFTVVGTTYGVGDGSTTFNIPDLRGRIPAGKDDMGGSAASRLTATTMTSGTTLGGTGGNQVHTLTTGEMPSHSHSVDIRRSAVASSPYTIYQLQTIVTGAWSSETFTSTSAGSGSAHNNVQPTIILNYIIRI